MSKLIKVLVFPAEQVELHDALSTCVNIEVWGATSVKRHGRFIYQNFIEGLPNITDPTFNDTFKKIIEQYHFDIVFPTHDTVAKYLADNAECFPTKIMGGDKFTADICRSKIKTHDLFKDTDFIPKRVYGSSEKMNFPLFVKPDDGQGGQGAKKINSIREIEDVDFENNIVTEYLPGAELTVDCLTDNKGNLRYVAPRTRERTMAGQSVAGHTLKPTEEILHIARIINERLNFIGLWFFQVRQDANGKFKLMEISTRCAGTMCLTRARGINLPLLSVYTAMGYDISISENSYTVEMERFLSGFYSMDYQYDTVYVDFDDTITLRGKVNLIVIHFLYQCRNLGKKIILLTKHANVIDETLQRYAISKLLFDEIISLNDNDDKSKFINSHSAIFIDNAFQERNIVAQNCHIPVFDVDQVEFLLDRRY